MPRTFASLDSGLNILGSLFQRGSLLLKAELQLFAIRKVLVADDHFLFLVVEEKITIKPFRKTNLEAHTMKT